MPANKATAAILFERANEQLRQERETFDQRKSHAAKWFYLQLVMGSTSICLLILITFVTSYVVLNPSRYSGAVVTSCSVALLTDVLGMLTGVWKIILNPPAITRLSPATEVGFDDSSEMGKEREIMPDNTDATLTKSK